MLRAPDDPRRCPAEQATLDRGVAALRTQLPDLPAGGLSWRAEVLAEVPGLRLVARYDFDDPAAAGPPRRVVATFYPDDTGKRTAVLTSHLWRFLPGRLLRIPRPLGYDPGTRMLAQEFVPGRPLWDVAGGPGAAARMHRVGEALAELHAARIPGLGPYRRLADHLVELVQPHPMVLARRLPDLRRRVEALVAGLLDRDAAAARTDSVPVHRDLHPGNVVDSPDGVWLLGNDLLAVGDPALDLGVLSAHLRSRLPAEQARRQVGAFGDGYRAGGGEIDPGRVASYAALGHLRLAAAAYRTRRTGWDRTVGEQLELAARTHGPA